MLDKLYGVREDILDNLKGTPNLQKEQKKNLKEINDSDKKKLILEKTTSERFVGIIVDPNTLEPCFFWY